jgi:hypothetical protein
LNNSGLLHWLSPPLLKEWIHGPGLTVWAFFLGFLGFLRPL